MTPFLGISVTIIICFKSLNIVILVHKLANIWHFDPILRHLLCLGQKQVTMDTRNLKYDMVRRFRGTLALKVANIQDFYIILEHLLHLDHKSVTMETRNLKYDMTRTFPQSTG